MRVQPEYKTRHQWEALARQENLSYEVLELSLPPFLGGTGDAFDCCREWYRSSGRVRAVHGAFIDINPASGDPDFRELSQKRCRESCALAAALGARQVVLHASAVPFLRGAYLDSWAAVCAEFYLELAETYGVMLCIENSQDLDPTPLEALTRRTGGGVRLCLDIGHANYSCAPLEAWFDRLGSAIGCLHLSDNMGRFDDHLPLGDGLVDWALADRLWRGLGKELPITLEVGGIQGVERSLAYLRRHGYFGMES